MFSVVLIRQDLGDLELITLTPLGSCWLPLPSPRDSGAYLCLAFHMRPGDPDSDFHACAANSSPAEPFPLPLMIFFFREMLLAAFVLLLEKVHVLWNQRQRC